MGRHYAILAIVLMILSLTGAAEYIDTEKCSLPQIDGAAYEPFYASYLTGTALKISCYGNKVLLGTGGLTCMPGGKWDNVLPSCEDMRSHDGPKTTTCSSRDIPKGWVAPYKDSYGFFSGVTFSCSRGYELIGRPISNCLPGGIWSTPVPICRALAAGGCTKPKIPYLKTMKQTRYAMNEHIRFQCNHGYFLRGASQAKCLGRNKWDNPLPICSKIPPFCKYPSELKMGSFRPFQKQYGVGQKVTWKCNTNHVLRGAEVSTCTRSGGFKPPKPTCEPISGQSDLRGRQPGRFHLNKQACILPPLPVGMKSHPKRKYHAVGSEVTYSCMRGYRLDGSERTVCTTQGFTSDPPTCKRRQCDPPAIPTHGRLLGEYKAPYYYGNKVEYVCDEYFLMTGNRYASCQDDGRFFPAPPKCRPPSCRYECDYQEGRHCQCDIGCRYEKNCCTDFEQYCRKLYY